ncbi:MAG: hypothetical protein A2W01_00195 [Candidatus Solincola sediminis]|uniref:CN hydrolase domain-containing protein n=1 Tax=Candidatus Solincola sediminis TaxID=1797199 RepID=A0A1F2WHN5_9ACTN|nr:MAG: hypothetical protein A2Y75_03850 [Candidatus Solincola sediminis]OFW61693.1 MAG: hypothetical protein A2W01_00195 [Candidatus Solincola sediminis]
MAYLRDGKELRVMGESVRKHSVTAVQMESVNGDIAANLEKATALVEEAAQRGAKLIVLPEFMPDI